MKEHKKMIEDISAQYWTTQEFHANNSVTMSDFIENKLDEDVEVLMTDGSYAEIEWNGNKYAIRASGNGDFLNHKVEFELL